ncbi:MAG: anthranilate synthase component I family protein, partial [Ginsengibacter sp.]
NITTHLWDFMQRFEIKEVAKKPVNIAQGLFGYTTYDAIQFFDTINLSASKVSPKGGDLEGAIPLMRYRLYQYVIAVNHFKDELFICENHINNIVSESLLVESLIKSKDVPVYPFNVKGEETSSITNEEYIEMVKKGIASCHRGDVFQIVVSRQFNQSFTGDEFNVYRALRSINPSPYLFYFDYGDYKLIGSSPESQLIIENNKATVHTIAGTFKRTGDDEVDKKLAASLLTDKKENAEHVMLVDLARNDLSRMCDNVTVTEFSRIQYYSHVIHLVSEVQGVVRKDTNPFDLLAVTFPAGTLSGAPKYKAMQLINEFELQPRSYYGGCIGFIGFDGSCNHAIMIRTFLSKDNTFTYQAGAGIVAVSNPESELQEVNNKLNALKKAIEQAETLTL